MIHRYLQFGRVILILVVVLGAWQGASGFQSVPRSHLDTPDTYWDQRGVGQFDGLDRVIDVRDGRIQAVGMLREGPFNGSPEEAARAFLFAHEDWVGLEPSAKNLQMTHAMESPQGWHVRFVRTINGVPVYPGDVVVSLDKGNHAVFFATSLIPFSDVVATVPGLSVENAERIARDYLRAMDEPVASDPTELVIWAGDNRHFAPCWKYRGYHQEPMGAWEVLVDAHTGAVRRVRDRAWNLDGSGMVYRPDPITQAGVPYNTPGYVDNNDADTPQLTAQRVNVTLRDITWYLGFYFLSGPWVHLADITLPTGNPVMETTPVFNYTRSQQGFEDVMAYYHIDRCQRYIQSLGFSNIRNNSLAVDPHGMNSECNAQFSDYGDHFIHFGEGIGSNCVDLAEDAEIIWHEYGHSMQTWQIPGWAPNTDDSWAIGEGFSDYWGGSDGRTLSPNNPNWMGSWGGQSSFTGRSLQQGLHYPEHAGFAPHFSGMIWSQALWEAELLSTRTAINTLVVQSHYLYSASMTFPAAALALLSADQSVYQGRYSYAIADGSVPRGLLTRPANDTCPGYAISLLPYSYSGSTATADDDFLTAVGPYSPDVFFTLNLPCAYNITASLCGSGYDTGIEVRAGGPGDTCPGSVLIASNDDFCGTGSQVSFTTNAGWNYYIIVHGYATFAGPYTLNVTGTPSDPVPGNDACPGVINITSLPYVTSGSTCTATHNFNTCVSTVSPDVIYALQLPSCQTVTASLCGSQFDTGIEIRTGGACPGSQVVACNDDFCALRSQTQFVASAWQTYYIVVNGYGNNRGAYTLNVSAQPFAAPNDVCPGTTITSLPFTDTGNTSCAISNYNTCVGANSPEVVYSLTSQECQTVTVSLCASAYDTGLEVRRRGSCPGVDVVACSDDDCGLQSTVSFAASINDTYYILVHGYGLSAGAYSIQVTGTPGGVQSNDVCGGARDITALPYTDIGNTACATNNSANCVGASSPDVYYRLLLGTCSDVIARLCYSTYDTGIQVRTGGWCPGSDWVACNDDHSGCGEGSLQSIVQFRATPGQYYYITVHGYGASSGFYVLDVVSSACAPESLVVQRMGSGVFLDWAPVASAGTITYRVYRSSTPDVATLPGNLIATTGNAFHTDTGVLNNPQTRYFYAVTAEESAMAYVEQDLVADVAPVVEKLHTLQQRTESQARVIPAYVDPSAIEPPDPAKETIAH